MLTRAIDDSTFEVLVYDWINLHDDYICGHVKIDRNADEESDTRFWLFYPSGGSTPLNVGDLRRIFTFMAELNAPI